MTQKMLCLCAAVALLFAFATTNVASAQESAVPAHGVSAGCPCEFAPTPCPWSCCSPWLAKGGCPAVTYRIGPLGAIRPVVYAPVYRPVYTTRLAPRYVCPPVCPPPCILPPRAVYAPYCW